MIRAEIEAEVDGGLRVAEGHLIGERLADRLRREVKSFGEAIVGRGAAVRATGDEP